MEEETKKDFGISPIEARIEEAKLSRRTVFLWGQVDDQSAKHVIDRLFYLDSLEPGKEISLIINSPGGLNTAGFAILDAIDFLSSPVSTGCTGLAASFGALILLYGKRKRRWATPHARIMLHQPWIPGDVQGAVSDLAIQAREIQKQRDEMNRIIASRCEKDLSQVELDTDRDFWLDAEDCVRYGVIDFVLSSQDELS